MKEIKDFAAAPKGVNDEELKVLLPSEKQAISDNRIGWTSTYLKKQDELIVLHEGCL